jgi:hypothetical protein
MMFRFIPHILSHILWLSILTAQFGKTQVSFDDRLLKGNERQILFTLESELKRFYTNTNWDEEFSDLSIPLSIHIVFEGVAPKGAVQTVLAQALFTSGTDQRYYDSGFQFIYNDAGSIYFDPVLFDPLSSFFAYYGYLILASEVDTYIPVGGNTHFETARNIALRGNSSDYSRGWKDRLQLCDNLSENFGLRKAKFAYYYAMELLQNGELERSVEELENMITGLDEVYDRFPRERYTLYFLNNHAKTLADALSLLGQEEFLLSLKDLDTDNEAIYDSALVKISR